MIKRIITTVTILLFIGTIAFGVIAYSRGYRFDTTAKIIQPTGILSASSYPEKASIWLNDKLVGTTNASLSLNPDWYTVRISREGYQSWEKRIAIQAEIVNQIDALLIPGNPSLRTLTVHGVATPVLSPKNNKAAYMVPYDETDARSATPKAGIWAVELKTGTFGGKPEPKLLYPISTVFDVKNITLHWSPDEASLLALFSAKDQKKETISRAILLSLEQPDERRDVTSTYRSFLTLWEEEKKENDRLTLGTFPPLLSSFLATGAAGLRFSPDETKLLYVATGSAVLPRIINPPLIGTNSTPETRALEGANVYVYDKKEDKNYVLTNVEKLQNLETLLWYSDSKHIILVENDTIFMIDYDGTNKRAAYGGPFEKSVLFSWPGGGKLVILTNLNNPKGVPNLYLIDLT